MPEPDFSELRIRLGRSGLTPRYVVRAISELQDHLEDIESECAEQGLSPAVAMSFASERIGTVESITRLYLDKPDLKCWVYRYPHVASVILPIAYVMTLPTIPIFAIVEHAPVVARWCAGIFMGAVVTASMLLAMHMSITSY